MRYFLEIAYKGTHFHGFQEQEGVPTIQGEINKTLVSLLGHQIDSVGSGRTDTGVHCLKQFMHFDTDKEISDKGNFIYRMNRILPSDILIKDIFPVREELSARFSANSRSYEYHITRVKNPFLNELAYFYPMPRLDVEKMIEATPILFNYTDFEAFSKVHTEVMHFICHIKKAEWKEEANGKLVFYITADRFLRGMVRAIVGTFLEVGCGRLSVQGFEQVIQSKDRRKAGRAVPPQGLYLVDVSYPSSIFM
ncbi:MAG: tRNA pseudouridine(38-40) synthase TruA [Thermoflexibacter sp.]